MRSLSFASITGNQVTYHFGRSTSGKIESVRPQFFSPAVCDTIEMSNEDKYTAERYTTNVIHVDQHQSTDYRH